MPSISLATSNGALASTTERHPKYQELKSRVHQELLNRLNLERLTEIDRKEAEPDIRNVVVSILDSERAEIPLSLFERDGLISNTAEVIAMRM